jgi:UDP-N-acetylmuramate--alanine ligase
MSLLNNNEIKHIHFIGIGGAGMSGIAEILVSRGYQVSGSDVAENAATKQLQAMGAKILRGHAATNINNADVVVYSSAISPDNSELTAAQQARIPVLQRAQMLGELMQSQIGIAIAGTHGKTTTTGLVSTVLIEAELDPTFVIGGLLVSFGANARVGNGQYFVAEADESDKSFLYLSPKIVVVTNIDADHLNNYGNFANLKQTFVHFIERLPPDGLAILCSDDPVICELLPQIKRRVITYGFQPSDTVHALSYVQQGTRCQISVVRQFKTDILEVTLNLPGRHNVLNALAAIAVATHCGISDEVIARALTRYQGTGRRFQVYGEIPLSEGQVLLIDDYGHHPREIAATIEGIRKAWPERRLVVAFQPHRYSRTQSIFDDFVQALTLPDVLLLLDIYSAGEAPIPGVTGKVLYDAIHQQSKTEVHFIENVSELPLMLRRVLKSGDILLTQGAGDIGKIAPQISQMKL